MSFFNGNIHPLIYLELFVNVSLLVVMLVPYLLKVETSGNGDVGSVNR